MSPRILPVSDPMLGGGAITSKECHELNGYSPSAMVLHLADLPIVPKYVEQTWSSVWTLEGEAQPHIRGIDWRRTEREREIERERDIY